MHTAIEALERRQLFAVLLPDLNFGNDGIASLEPSSDVTPLTNGKILALGGGYKTLLADGSPDPASSDAYTGFFDNTLALPNGVAYQVENVIRGTETSDEDLYFIGLAKFDADGELDESFGTNGKAEFTYPPEINGTPYGTGRIDSIALRADGKILIAGGVAEPLSVGGAILLMQFTVDGELDTTFGDNGAMAFPIDGTLFENEDFQNPTVRVDALNRPVVYAAAANATGNGRLFRLTADNELDTIFSGDGKVTFAGQQGLLEIDGANRPVVAFTSVTGSGESTQQRVNIRRFTTAGAVDTTFGTAGTASFADPQRGSGTDLDVDGSNRVVIGLEDKVYRLTANGVLDSAFAESGQIDLTDVYRFPLQINVINDNKVLVSDGETLLQLVPRPAVILANDGLLALTGTTGSDTISVTRSGSTVTATVNGTTETYDADDVRAFSLVGNAGDDQITVSDLDIYTATGSLDLYGGAGNDTYTLTDSGKATVLDIGGNSTVTAADTALNFTSQQSATDTIAVTGDDGATITTGIGSDITTGAGADTISFAGQATINSGAGDDFIYMRPFLESRGTAGSDIDAGGGADRVILDDAQFSDTINGGAGDDFISDSFGLNFLSGGDGDDFIKGGAARDEITGNAGNDTLRGNGGNDLVSGNGGNDRLFGGDGLDYVYGGDGNDSMDGNAGSDHLYGGLGLALIDAGGGNDTIEVVAQATVFSGAGNDEIFARNGVIDLILGGRGSDTGELDANDEDSSIETLLA